MNDQKVPTGVGVVIIIVLAVTVGVLVYFFEKNKWEEIRSAPLPSVAVKKNVTKDESAPILDKTYRNEKYAFRFDYDKNFCLKEGEQKEDSFMLEVYSKCPVPETFFSVGSGPHDLKEKEVSFAVVSLEKSSKSLDEYVKTHMTSKEKETISLGGTTVYKFSNACSFNAMHGHATCTKDDNFWHFKDDQTGYIFTVKGDGVVAEKIIGTFALGTVEEAIVGSDRDSHGCIGSAGYQWCDEKQKCLKEWEESCGVIDISKWKTYQYNKCAISFKYPNEWEIVLPDDPSGGVALRSPGYETLRNESGTVEYKGEFYVLCNPNPKNLSIEEEVEGWNDGTWLWFKNFEHESIKVSGHTAIRFPLIDEMNNKLNQEVFFIKGDKNIINFSYIFQEKDANISKILDFVVKTFSSE